MQITTAPGKQPNRSRWTTESFALDHSEHVDAWVKNDHLGFEVLYVYRGVVKKYRPDFLIRLRSGLMLVLEVKGQDSDENQAKRSFLDEWVNAVNQHGGFGRWSWDVSLHPADVDGILAKHAAADAHLPGRSQRSRIVSRMCKADAEPNT